MFVSIQSYLLYIRVRFDQPDYSRPCARGSVRLRVWNSFVRHRGTMGEGSPRISAPIAIYFTFLANSPGETGSLRRTLARGERVFQWDTTRNNQALTQGIVVAPDEFSVSAVFCGIMRVAGTGR